MSAVRDRCSLRSELATEPLAGSASTVRRWLLIEHDGPWGRQGLLDARLPDGLGLELHDAARHANARTLLIRRPDRRRAGGVRCFAVDAGQPEPWVGTVDLERIADAVTLDPRDRAPFRTIDGPLALVCTHGRRDPCCAERGRPLATASAVAFPDETWESTHIGGDRFAANMVVFPHGFYFGHVEAIRGPEIIEAYRSGRIVLDRYRGRCSVPMPAQAAEHHVRSMLTLDGIDDVIPFATVEHGDVITVSLHVRAGADSDPAESPGVYRVQVRAERGAPMRLTCHAITDEAPYRWVVEGADRIIA